MRNRPEVFTILAPPRAEKKGVNVQTDRVPEDWVQGCGSLQGYCAHLVLGDSLGTWPASRSQSSVGPALGNFVDGAQ